MVTPDSNQLFRSYIRLLRGRGSFSNHYHVSNYIELILIHAFDLEQVFGCRKGSIGVSECNYILRNCRTKTR